MDWKILMNCWAYSSLTLLSIKCTTRISKLLLIPQKCWGFKLWTWDQPRQTEGVLLNPTTLHVHFHPIHLQSTKRPICGASITIQLAPSLSTCLNCQCVRVRPLKWPCQMPDDECSCTRGGSIKESQEDPKGVWRISDLSIKIEWGPNIFSLKDNSWVSPFKTRPGLSRGISWCCLAEVTIGVCLIMWQMANLNLDSVEWSAGSHYTACSLACGPHTHTHV